MVDSSVTNSKIADDSVNSDHYATGAVVEGKLSTSSVGSDQIADEAVTTVKFADGSVTPEKLTESPFIQNGIIIWFKETLPDGFVECDGDNGTPDLRNKFIVGAGDSYSVGDTGGSNTGTTASAGAHTHTGSTTGAGAHTHGGFSQPHALSNVEIPAHRHLLAYGVSMGSRSGLGSASHNVAHQNANGAYHEEYVLLGNASEPTLGLSSVPYQYNSSSAISTGYGHAHGFTASSTHTHTLNLDSAGAHTHTISDQRPRYYDIKFIMKV
jgi:hypothetical protein